MGFKSDIEIAQSCEMKNIREIAATLGCSENTVKSRLNYGRQNLKKKAEELQKKGYKLYSVAPLPLFLYLLRSQAGYLDKAGSLAAGGKSVAQNVFGAVSHQSAAEAARARLLPRRRLMARQ